MRSSSVQPFDPLDYWHWLRIRVRCGLAMQDPRIFRQLENEGQRLAYYGQLRSGQATEKIFQTLLDTLEDQALPWHWRNTCLEQAYQLLARLEQQVQQPVQWQRLKRLSQKLDRAELKPSIHHPDDLA